MGRSVADRAVPIERPSLAYHSAFDLCALEASRAQGPVAVYASSLFHARELARRLSGEVVLCLPPHLGLDEPAVRAVIGPEVDWHRVRLDTGQQGSEWGAPRVVLWAEPEKQACEGTLDNVRQLMDPPVRLCVLGTTKLRHLLPEWRGLAAGPARAPLASMGEIARALRRLGYATQRLYGFHGPLSLFWGFASRLSAAIGRDDLVDRCLAAMRRTYLVRGWQAMWAPVWMLTAAHSVD